MNSPSYTEDILNLDPRRFVSLDSLEELREPDPNLPRYDDETEDEAYFNAAMEMYPW